MRELWKLDDMHLSLELLHKDIKLMYFSTSFWLPIHRLDDDLVDPRIGYLVPNSVFWVYDDS